MAQRQGWEVITTEGGHRSYAPTTARELRLYQQLGGYEKHLSAENLLSGAGIATIYQALGIPREAMWYDVTGRPNPIYMADPIEGLFA